MGGGRNWTGKQFHRSTPWLERWIAAEGSRYADGSRDAPFNPNSAAFRNFDNVLAQAIHHLPQPTDATDENTPRVVRVRQGQIAAEGNVVIPGRGSYHFDCNTGYVSFPGDLEIIRIFDPTTYGGTPLPAFLSIGGGALWDLPDTTFHVWDTGLRAAEQALHFERVFGPNISQDANTFTTETYIRAVECGFGSTFELPDVIASDLDRVSIEQTMEVLETGLLRTCYIGDDVIVTAIPTSDLAIFLACRIDGDFDGPAGSAVFDDITAAMFNGTYASGSGPDDWLSSGLFFMFQGYAQDLASGTTTSYRGAIPNDADIVSIHAKAAVAPIMTVGTCLLTADAEGDNLLVGANFDMETLANDTWTELGLTGTAADLQRDEGDSITLDVVTGATLQGATGTNVRFAVRYLTRE